MNAVHDAIKNSKSKICQTHLLGPNAAVMHHGIQTDYEILASQLKILTINIVYEFCRILQNTTSNVVYKCVKFNIDIYA